MNEAKRETVIYAVSSKRTYSGGEDYFGTDGIFRTYEEARTYVYGDMDSLFDEGIVDEESATVNKDDFVIQDGDNFFKWQIEPLSNLPPWIQIKEGSA